MEKNIKRRKKAVLTKKMQVKMGIVFLLIILLLFGLSIRILYINSTKGEDYTVQVLKQQNYSSAIIPYQRGDILDRNGVTLATSVKVYNLILDPKVMLSDEKYLEPTLDALVECFGYDRLALLGVIQENEAKSYVKYDKKLSYDTIKGFIEIQNNTKENPYVKGVWFEDEYERKYPYSTLACHVLGFTSAGNVGTWGIEEYYNETLNGTDGRQYGYVNSDNIMEQVVKAAQDGDTVVSTIDFNVQTIVEKYISQYNETYQPENIGVILMNPNNGEIYAMATNVSYDLHNPRDLTAFYTEEELLAMTDEEKLDAMNQIWRNFCLNDSYEPGSTFKPFTIGASLEEGTITPEQKFICDGFEVYAGNRIKCHKVSGHGEISIGQSIAYSCNDALMHIGTSLGINSFADYQARYNFGLKTGIDLPGEASCAGLLYTADNMREIDLAICSFGQSFNVTMVQMAAGFSSIVNGGYYYQPHVVSKILNSKGGVIEEVGNTVIKQTISKETSDILREGLVMCVEGGTGSAAAVEGYTIGGKTGTAQKLPREEKKYVYSFIGYAGDEEAEVVCYCVVDNPNDEMYSTSAAARLFSDIMEESLPYLGVFPDKHPEFNTDTDGDGVFDAYIEEDDTQQEDSNIATDNPNGDDDGEIPTDYVTDNATAGGETRPDGDNTSNDTQDDSGESTQTDDINE